MSTVCSFCDECRCVISHISCIFFCSSIRYDMQNLMERDLFGLKGMQWVLCYCSQYLCPVDSIYVDVASVSDYMWHSGTGDEPPVPDLSHSQCYLQWRSISSWSQFRWDMLGLAFLCVPRVYPYPLFSFWEGVSSCLKLVSGKVCFHNFIWWFRSMASILFFFFFFEENTKVRR